MTVGYYRLPSWAYGLEHQNTAPFSDRDSDVHGQLSPPFDERSTSNLAWSPLNGCGYTQGLCLRELFWLARRISLELA